MFKKSRQQYNSEVSANKAESAQNAHIAKYKST